MHSAVELLYRGRRTAICGDRVRMTLLDWLRTEQRATGTKEGCAEGDCGACTVVLARWEGGRLVHRAVNACILMAGQAHGSAVLTIEDLARSDGSLHAVQEAMVTHHGAQCGFCTPGIVMSLYALHQDAPPSVTREMISDRLAGNLCRCTGYRPILDAALDACARPAEDKAGLAEALARLSETGRGDIMAGDDNAFFAAPASEASLQGMLARYPDALLLAGGTDAGLWITKHLANHPQVIWLGRVAGLGGVTRDGGQVVIGAMATHAAASAALAGLAPDLGEIMRRFGSTQVRNTGTVGGNIANASPIGDLAPCLIALAATLELGSAAGPRALPLENYFIAYKEQDRRPGEYVRRILVPQPSSGTIFKAFKISKRMDEDISAVLGAFGIRLDGRRIRDARIAFGGMAGIPARARGAEAALAGADLDQPTTWDAALDALGADYAPIDDLRASAAYRKLVAGNLLRKALVEIAGADLATTRLNSPREAYHGG
jgi:xanthine dehydrogenase small subunit